MDIKAMRNPMLFQERNKTKPFFEGWYFRHVSADMKKSISIIPGISKNVTDTHAFIQTILNLESGLTSKPESHYHSFLPGEFTCTDHPFCLRIGKNTFQRDVIQLDLSDSSYSLQGTIRYSPFTPIKTSLLCPNIMGYFSYLPIMECYHGIISMSHRLRGTLTVNEEEVDFSGGKGYLEKDWGTSFPKEYVWLQSNHFPGSDASIVCSVADIPFLGTSFQGFICNLTVDDNEYRFASYNRSRLDYLRYKKHRLEIAFSRCGITLELSAEVTKGGLLKAPKNGVMNHTIREGANGTVDVMLRHKGKTLFTSTGYVCGIEVVKSLQQ